MTTRTSPPLSDAFVRRLNQASAKRRFYPYDQEVVDWSVPITDDYLYVPKDVSVFRNAPFFEQLHREDQSFLTRYEITQLFRNIGHGEHLLTQGLLANLWGVSQYDPSWRYALHEAAEECQHMMMFSEWLRLNPDIRTRGIGEERLGPLAAFVGTSVIAPMGPEYGWVMILAFEAVGDVINESLRKAGDEVHPILRQIGRAHTAEEGRHIAYAEAWLKDRLLQMGKLRRFAFQTFTEALARQLLRGDRFLPLPYSEQIAHLVSKETFLDVKQKSPSIATYHLHAAKTVNGLAKLGLIRPRTLRSWRGRGRLTAAVAS